VVKRPGRGVDHIHALLVLCSSLSQRQHAVGCQGKNVAVIALHNCGKSYSQNFVSFKPLKISGMCVFQAVKRYEELGSIEDRAQSGRLKSVRAEDAIKTAWEGIRQNPLWKQIMSRKLNIST